MDNHSDILRMVIALKQELEDVTIEGKSKMDRNYKACVSYLLFRDKVNRYIDEYGDPTFKERFLQ